MENEDKDEADRLQGTFIHDIFEQAYLDSDFLNITRWIAYPPNPDNYLTITSNDITRNSINSSFRKRTKSHNYDLKPTYKTQKSA